MSGSENSTSTGRLTALATLAASGALFLAALFGIASIDPNADAASPAGGPAIHNISLDQKRDAAGERRDCPYRDRDRSRDGAGAADGVQS